MEPPCSMSSRRTVGAGIGARRAAVGALLVLAVSGCSDSGDPRVEADIVGRATVSEVVDAPGTVGAKSTARVTAPAEGSVAEVLVRDGATVAKGAVLARLSSPAAQDRLRQALAAQARAADASVPVPRADVTPTQDALDAAAAQTFATARAAAAQVPDVGARAAAERQIDDNERQYRLASEAAREAVRQLGASADGIEKALASVAGTQLDSATRAVAAARATVASLTVVAPIAGVVTLGGADAPAAQGADLGALVDGLPEAVQDQASQALGDAGGRSGSTTSDGLSVGSPLSAGAPLLTVTDVSGLSVLAEVDETDVLLVKPGTPAVVEVDAVPGAQYPATVVAVDLAPSSSARGGVSYRVRLSLRAGRTGDDQPAPPPRPGMSAVVDLQVRTARGAVAVPSAAVVRDDGRDAVFVVEAGRVVRREVRLGAQGEDLVEVLAGVEPGDRVVVRDADRLSDGQAVQS